MSLAREGAPDSESATCQERAGATGGRGLRAASAAASAVAGARPCFHAPELRVRRILAGPGPPNPAGLAGPGPVTHRVRPGPDRRAPRPRLCRILAGILEIRPTAEPGSPMMTSWAARESVSARGIIISGLAPRPQ